MADRETGEKVQSKPLPDEGRRSTMTPERKSWRTLGAVTSHGLSHQQATREGMVTSLKAVSSVGSRSDWLLES